MHLGCTECWVGPLKRFPLHARLLLDSLALRSKAHHVLLHHAAPGPVPATSARAHAVLPSPADAPRGRQHRPPTAPGGPAVHLTVHCLVLDALLCVERCPPFALT